jgi:excisionase family DNA binding protein
MSDRTVRTRSRLLTVEQAAEWLNVSPAYVRRRLIFPRRIAYVKIGRHVRIDERDLERLIEAGRIRPERQSADVPAPRYDGHARRRARKGDR